MQQGVKAPYRSGMEHIAMWEGTGDGSPETRWAEPVTDAQYNGSRSRND